MNNLERLIEAIKGSDADALMLTSCVNRFFATGFYSTAGVCLITREKGYLFTDFRYIEAAMAQAKSFDVRMTDREEPYWALINKAVSEHGIKKLGYEEEKVSVSEHAALSERLGAQLIAEQGLVTKLRAEKQPEEIALIKKAQEITDLTFSQILPLIKTGICEKELSSEIVYRLLKNGADNVSFDPIVVSGENTSMPHGAPGGRTIKNGDFVAMDFGCIYKGYCSDMTRTVCVGSADDEMKKIYGIVLNAQSAGIKAARAGVSGSFIDAAARSFIEKEGYGEYFGHGFGHGVGIEIHEKPGASPSEKEALPVGAVITAEPGIYLPGRFGVRIEDMIIINENGSENITASPKKLITV